MGLPFFVLQLFSHTPPPQARLPHDKGELGVYETSTIFPQNFTQIFVEMYAIFCIPKGNRPSPRGEGEVTLLNVLQYIYYENISLYINFT